MKAFDFLGKEINIGDIVVFVQLHYRDLSKGTITKITPKTVLISHDKTNWGSKEIRQYHSQVIKCN